MFYMCGDNSPYSGLHIYQVNKKSTEICSATHLWNTKRNPLKYSPYKKRVEKEKMLFVAMINIRIQVDTPILKHSRICEYDNTLYVV